MRTWTIILVTLTFGCGQVDNSDIPEEELQDILQWGVQMSRDSISLPYIISCDNYESVGSHSMLFLTESANIAPIEDKYLSTWLTQEELTTALDTFIDPKYTDPVTRKHQYYYYGPYLQADNYTLIILNHRDNYSHGRNYYFLARTFDKEWNVVSTLTFATWSDAEKKYISGTIKEDLTIELASEEGQTETWKIADNGKIEKI